MWARVRARGALLLGLLLHAWLVPPLSAWDADLELLDLVEEIPHTFYHFLSVAQDAPAADIRRAYRRLSLLLHPDRNREEDAETRFRQLVAIYEVLKDEERRRRYDDILLNGLPDWRQPVFYYRRVRKMSNAELAFLLFLILTVGHYAVLWSIYLEKQLDEMLSKKKKEKKKRVSSRAAEEPRSPDRVVDQPRWHDLLPLKLSAWLYLSVRSLPQSVQGVKQYYEDYQQMKQRQQDQAEAGRHLPAREKRPKVKKAKVEFPEHESWAEGAPLQGYEQSTSIEEVEHQMDDWLLERRASRRKAADWTEDELSLLSRLMVKFPGGTPGRWEKIAQDLGRSVTEVTAKVKQVKEGVSQAAGLVKLSELKGERGACEEEQKEEAAPVRRRSKRSAAPDAGEAKVRGHRQRDFDPAAAAEEEEEEEELESRERAEAAVWTQNQQKLLELALQQFPRGTAERWDRIARVVPGKTKEDCMIRFKMLAELVQRRKQAKS